MRERIITVGEDITDVPAGVTQVKVEGFSLDGEGRRFGLRLMRMAGEMGGFSPGNTNIPDKRSFQLSLKGTRSPEENRRLVRFLRMRMAEGCRVILSEAEVA